MTPRNASLFRRDTKNNSERTVKCLKVADLLRVTPEGELGDNAYTGGVMDMAAIGEAIRAARAARHWGQDDLSAATTENGQRIGISVQTISEIETGTTTDPRLGTIARLCRALSLSIAIEPDGSARIRESSEGLDNVGSFLSTFRITPAIADAVVVIAFAALDAVGHSVTDRPAPGDRTEESEARPPRAGVVGQDSDHV
jgi:transcriptional regulator with XRE-family HTH domain